MKYSNGEFQKLKDVIRNNGLVKIQRNIANEMYADNYSVRCIGDNFNNIFNRKINDSILKSCLARFNRNMNDVNFYVDWNDFQNVIADVILSYNKNSRSDYLQINRGTAEILYEHYYPIAINYTGSKMFAADKSKDNCSMEDTDAYCWMPVGTRRQYFVNKNILDYINIDVVNQRFPIFYPDSVESKHITMNQTDVLCLNTKAYEQSDLNQVIQEFVRRFRIQVEDELKQKYESVISEYQYKLNVANSELKRLQNILESFKKILSSN